MMEWSVCHGDFSGFAELRRAVLRGGRPDAQVVYPFDQAPTTRHYSVRSGGDLTGIATVESAVCPQLDVAHRRLALMAVAPPWQGRGVGAAIVRHILRDEREDGQILWAAARVSALRFYTRLGLQPVGGVYAGPENLLHRIVADVRRD